MFGHHKKKDIYTSYVSKLFFLLCAVQRRYEESTWPLQQFKKKVIKMYKNFQANKFCCSSICIRMSSVRPFLFLHPTERYAI